MSSIKRQTSLGPSQAFCHLMDDKARRAACHWETPSESVRTLALDARKASQQAFGGARQETTGPGGRILPAMTSPAEAGLRGLGPARNSHPLPAPDRSAAKDRAARLAWSPGRCLSR